MVPRIETPFGVLYPYALMATLGILALFCVLHRELAKYPDREREEGFIAPAIVASGLVALGVSVFADSLFKIGSNGGLVLSGSTFYGGLLGACASMYVILGVFGGRTGFSRREWFDLLTVPLIVFHIFGRLGCFLAGCCYGVETDGPLGVAFPDNPETGVYHDGAACYPTQLFEVLALAVIALIVLRASRRFETYLFSYAAARFFIEFFRGDYRGFTAGFLSPAQVISIVIIAAVALLALRRSLHGRNASLDAGLGR